VSARAARSLKSKLLFVVLLTTLVAVMVALAAMILYDVRLYQRSWEADIRTQAELLGRTSAPALLFDDPQVAHENLGLLRYRTGVLAAAIYDQRGARIATYLAPGAELELPALPGADGSSLQGGDLVVFQRIVQDDQILGTVYLRAAYDLVPRIASYLGIALVAAVLAMSIAYLLSARLQRIVSQPILDGGQEEGRQQHGQYAERGTGRHERSRRRQDAGRRGQRRPEAQAEEVGLTVLSSPGRGGGRFRSPVRIRPRMRRG
jgi:hypothetical protein